MSFFTSEKNTIKNTTDGFFFASLKPKQKKLLRRGIMFLSMKIILMF